MLIFLGTNKVEYGIYTLISAKNHKKKEFDFDGAVRDFLQYYNSKT